MIVEFEFDGAHGGIVAKMAFAFLSPASKIGQLMPSRKKINLEKVLASLNATCPTCGGVIESQDRRVSWDEN